MGKRQASVDGTKRRIIEAAVAEYSEKGIEDTSMQAVARRARDLSLKYVYQKVENKLAVFEQLCKELALQPTEVAYMGDDWLDLALLARVGFSASVADGVLEVRQLVDFVAKSPGGRGAVREVCDLILEAKDVHKALFERYVHRCSK